MAEGSAQDPVVGAMVCNRNGPPRLRAPTSLAKSRYNARRERASLPLDIQPLQNMGARVLGVDLTCPIPEDVQVELRFAWARYGVLVFPESGRSNEEQLRLSHVFGPSEPHEMEVLIVKDERELIMVSGEQPDEVLPLVVDGRVRAAWLFWHQDESYPPNIPLSSMLRSVTPTAIDGETGYLDVARAYDDLPAAGRERIDGLGLG